MIDRDVLGRGVVEALDHGVLPADPVVRDAVLDLDEVSALVCGDTAGDWLGVIDAARAGGDDARREFMRLQREGASRARWTRCIRAGQYGLV